ncbi:putative zinc type alcohol dehydrogenase [Rhizoctonia solani 123E]|uniref:Putative zinc type alcohol dehydrogenase n=1 Tax=Rhizoctonia solani 123E TaxID=1423351 RepID=A0A074SDB8_9AGAM|nr:putative zinc type alcohol dehydrogenase [Rhizoctonia solani 123E]
MTQQQKASLLLEKHGKLEVGARPIPVPQGKQALVKVTAAGVNPLDWKIIDYGIFVDKFPTVLGFDGAGVIHAVGPDVAGFKIGDRVLFQGAFDSVDQRAYQQYAIVDTEILAKTPNNINDDQASTIATGAVTAYFSLFQKTGVSPPLSGPTASGRSILILGGSSSVGQFAIQFARLAGFSNIATTASSQHADLLKSLGATHLFDRDVDVKAIQSAFATPLSFVFDTISVESTQLFAFDILTTPSPVPGARLSILLDPTESLKEKNLGDKVSVDHILGSSYMFRDVSIPFWKRVEEWIKKSEIVPNRVQLVKGGLAGIPDALNLSRKGVSGVKVVVRPQE